MEESGFLSQFLPRMYQTFPRHTIWDFTQAICLASFLCLLQQTFLGLKGITFSMTSNIKSQQSQTILNHFSYMAVRMALIVVWGNHHGPVWNILKNPQIFIDICTKRQISRPFVISRFFCYAKLSYCMYIVVVVSMWPCSKCCCLQVV